MRRGDRRGDGGGTSAGPPRAGGRHQQAEDHGADTRRDPGTIPLQRADPEGGAPPSPAPTPTPGGRAQRRRKKQKPLWRRVLLWGSASLAFLIVAVALGVYLYVEHLNGNLERRELNLGNSQVERSRPNADGQVPLNILLLGSDSREGAANAELGGGGDGGQRADVQILMHASADRSNVTLISIPRDTMVSIPECTDPDTGETYPALTKAAINSSLGHGGPGCTVATWEELTGIPIDHFMMLDFAGVVSMADAVGGVPVCVSTNITDPDSHLRLPAGDNIVQGEEALQWLRTRHAFGDGSDVGRTRAQQMYLSNMVDELQNSTSLTNPGQLMDLAEAATNALTVDHGLGSVQNLYDLGQDLRSIPGDRMNSVTLPWLPDPDDENRIVPDMAEAEALFALVRDDIPLDDQDAAPAEPDPEASGEATPDPEDSIPVAVRNGTGADGQIPVDGRASVITEALQGLGFTQAATDATMSSEVTTRVLYADAADKANAQAVAGALGLPGSAVRISTSVEQVTLIIGADWREGTEFTAPTEEPPADGSGGTDGGGEEGGGQAVDEEDILSGADSDTCMDVNPLPMYTW
ncbi:LCP family protein [Streptomyces avicenniae]|uniref:LCP family protein n=1 Tax=Streptomyces avicenniae TaxID=500153 RepID=UPI0006994876|nr:LCP family protein [Streptomyces avicenniae]